ncbi:MAG: MerR family transcriptional regulator [Gammaproteobacteria bacterium]|nr:MerR family transcriptional regulator [Gammaproteobacteria bacterium]
MTSDKILCGQLVEEATVITLKELCRSCTVKTEEIIIMVEEGILDPQGERLEPAQATEWQFHISSVKRVKTVVHLQRDLGVNLPGAALALELLDRIAELKKL